MVEADDMILDDDGVSMGRRPNTRRVIIEDVLRNGAAWEVPTVDELLRSASVNFPKPD